MKAIKKLKKKYLIFSAAKSNKNVNINDIPFRKNLPHDLQNRFTTVRSFNKKGATARATIYKDEVFIIWLSVDFVHGIAGGVQGGLPFLQWNAFLIVWKIIFLILGIILG